MSVSLDISPTPHDDNKTIQDLFSKSKLGLLDAVRWNPISSLTDQNDF